MEECIFCKIATGSLPSEIVHRDDLCVAFRDIHPQAPTHILVIPRAHLSSLSQATPEHAALLGHLMCVCAKVAREAGIEEDGYRVVTNTGRHGAQTVEHLHLHVLGGRQLDGGMG